MEVRLAGLVYQVTGGAAGVGLATVRSLLADSALVAACARHQGPLAAATTRSGRMGHPDEPAAMITFLIVGCGPARRPGRYAKGSW
jgi:NADP-dependent 3-hydroxy acid dehydrogenase YdfG